MKRTTRDDDDYDDQDPEEKEEEEDEQQNAAAAPPELGGGPLNEPEKCTLSEDFLDKCLQTFELLEDTNSAIREAQQAKNNKLRQCQYLLQTLALDKVKSAILQKHESAAWFVGGVSEVVMDTDNALYAEVVNDTVVVRIHTNTGLDRVTLTQEDNMVYIMNPLAGRWRGDILQKHRKFLEGIRNIRGVLLELVRLYTAVSNEHKDPEKLWKEEFRDLIIIAKRSYLCKRENEKPTQPHPPPPPPHPQPASTSSSSSNPQQQQQSAPPSSSKPKAKRRHREQTPAAGSRASIAVNREVTVVEFDHDDQV